MGKFENLEIVILCHLNRGKGVGMQVVQQFLHMLVILRRAVVVPADQFQQTLAGVGKIVIDGLVRFIKTGVRDDAVHLWPQA